jgi:RNA polymerase sigma-70 factor (ECF subfamily)
MDEQIRSWAAQIAQSDRHAFECLFRLLYPRLVGFAIQYTKSKSVAGDIVQDAFVVLWEKREQTDPDRSLRSYLYTIVRNRALNHIRDHSGRTVEIDQVPESQLKAPQRSDTKAVPDFKIKLVREWIENLPARQKEAFKLSRYEGLEHDEIAKVMNISSNTVNNHIVGALRNLRQQHDVYQNKTNKDQQI